MTTAPKWAKLGVPVGRKRTLIPPVKPELAEQVEVILTVRLALGAIVEVDRIVHPVIPAVQSVEAIVVAAATQVQGRTFLGMTDQAELERAAKELRVQIGKPG